MLGGAHPTTGRLKRHRPQHAGNNVSPVSAKNHTTYATIPPPRVLGVVRRLARRPVPLQSRTSAASPHFGATSTRASPAPPRSHQFPRTRPSNYRSGSPPPAAVLHMGAPLVRRSSAGRGSKVASCVELSRISFSYNNGGGLGGLSSETSTTSEKARSNPPNNPSFSLALEFLPLSHQSLELRPTSIVGVSHILARFLDAFSSVAIVRASCAARFRSSLASTKRFEVRARAAPRRNNTRARARARARARQLILMLS